MALQCCTQLPALDLAQEALDCRKAEENGQPGFLRPVRQIGLVTSPTAGRRVAGIVVLVDTIC